MLNLKTFKEITDAIGVSGNEKAINKLLKEKYQKLGYPIIEDKLGSIFAYKKSSKKNAKKVLIIAHLDEVGFMVKEITPQGLIKVNVLGGFNKEILPGSRVKLVNRAGQEFLGYINALPPHLMEGKAKEASIADLLFDFGFIDEEDAKKNISLGDSVVLDGEFKLLNKQRILSKALDNRFGCFLGLEILEHFKNYQLDYDLYVGASVQEEVGVRGATTASNLVKPDLAIVLDCSPANDFVKSDEFGKLGGGILIRFIDASMIPWRFLLDFQVKSAIKSRVPYQYYLSPGGTDAGIIHKSLEGIPTLTHCICARNIHSGNSLIDKTDYQAAFKSLVYMIKNINDDLIDNVKRSRR